MAFYDSMHGQIIWGGDQAFSIQAASFPEAMNDFEGASFIEIKSQTERESITIPVSDIDSLIIALGATQDKLKAKREDAIDE